MLSLFADAWQTLRMRTRYRRRIQEQLLALSEQGSQAVADRETGWTPVGHGGAVTVGGQTRSDQRSQARRLVNTNPHAANLLRVMEIYVVGPKLSARHVLKSPAEPQTDADGELLLTADRLWEEFLIENRRHYSFREHARRGWRDGEAFVRLFDSEAWPPRVRFVDPERIATPVGSRADVVDGIQVDPHDAEMPLAYLLVDARTGVTSETLPAEEVLHTKRCVDSNQTRGVTLFAPVIATLSSFEQWRETELQARKLQASIVLWRKVQGGPAQAQGLADRLASLAPDAPPAPVGSVDPVARRERYRPGSIVTTSQGTSLEFLQPNTNFGDAVPLGRMLLLSLAAGAGLPEFMLTADASNANFASTMVAEGPAVKLFESEQHLHADEFTTLWRMVMTRATDAGLLPADFFARCTLDWTFPPLVSRDRNADRLSNVKLAEADILSKAEVARRDGADPDQMRREISEERSDTAS